MSRAVERKVQVLEFAETDLLSEGKMNFELCATNYLNELQTGSNPVRPKTLAAYRSTLRKHLLPRFGQMDLATMAHQNNRLLRDLVRDLRGDYAPASIRLFATVLQSVIDHPRDDNGVRLFKCDWNLDFADLPAVIPAQQKAPMIPTDELQAAVAHHELGLMFAILAGTGLRVGELLALQRADWNRAGAIITVRASKTQAGIREIDLPRVLNDRMLAGLPAAQDRLFPHGTTYYRDRAENVTGAFHSMRRFRLTHLRTMGMPEDLISLAMGHANKTIGDRYSRVRLNKEFRREWTERAGLGFVL